MTHIYIVSDGDTEYKIGVHTGTEAKLRSRYMTYHRNKYKLHLFCETLNAREIEKKVLSAFTNKRITSDDTGNQLEWIRCELTDIMKLTLRLLSESNDITYEVDDALHEAFDMTLKNDTTHHELLEIADKWAATTLGLEQTPNSKIARVKSLLNLGIRQRKQGGYLIQSEYLLLTYEVMVPEDVITKFVYNAIKGTRRKSDPISTKIKAMHENDRTHVYISAGYRFISQKPDVFDILSDERVVHPEILSIPKKHVETVLVLFQ